MIKLREESAILYLLNFSSSLGLKQEFKLLKTLLALYFEECTETESFQKEPQGFLPTLMNFRPHVD